MESWKESWPTYADDLFEGETAKKAAKKLRQQ